MTRSASALATLMLLFLLELVSLPPAFAAQTGSLVVEKSADVDGTFHFDVDCDGAAYDTTLTITTSGGSGTATVSGVPTGTSCTVTEQANPLFSTQVTPSNGTVTIAVGDNTVSFTNTRLSTPAPRSPRPTQVDTATAAAPTTPASGSNLLVLAVIGVINAAVVVLLPPRRSTRHR